MCHLYADYKFLEYWSKYLDEHKNDYYPILILESELLFDKFQKDKNQILEYYSKVNFDKYNTTEEEIKKWHNALKQVIPVKMNKELFKKLAINIIGANEEWTNKILERYDEIKDDEVLRDKIKNIDL